MIWQTSPTARSTVPLPKLPAYLSSRLAISPERSEEFERLLYDNARGQIDDKFRLCPEQHAGLPVGPAVAVQALNRARNAPIERWCTG